MLDYQLYIVFSVVLMKQTALAGQVVIITCLHHYILAISRFFSDSIYVTDISVWSEKKIRLKVHLWFNFIIIK